MTAAYPTTSQETDADLLCLIGMAKDYPDAANEAFFEFHQRFASYLHTRLRMWISANPSGWARALDPETLSADTLFRAYKQASKYQDRSGGDLEKGSNQVKAWLFRIAQRLAFDELRKPEIRLLTTYNDAPDDEDRLSTAQPHPSLPNTKAAKIRAIVEGLPPIDRDIIEVCLANNAFGENADALPQQIRLGLLFQHGLTEATFRQRKKRALQKIKDAFQQ